MIPRLLSKSLQEASRKLPVVVVTGPRQSGKTTLVKSVFPKKPFLSLEDPDTREFALADPRGFLETHPGGAILDEAQRVPHLFSYIQTYVDQKQKEGMFILTGSQHFLLLENISQTLAGRTRILHLLPLSLEELKEDYLKRSFLEDVMFKGLYPRLYAKNIHPREWYPDYVQTYIERDVRLIKNVGDLSAFQRFLKMCAARTGQLLNLSSLANDCGITHNTARSWISILETSFVVYLLQPYHKNFGKRLVKAPKLYFYDTGLVSSLLGIENPEQWRTHPLRGPIFETFVMAEFMKARLNQGLLPRFYFWRDKTGNEVDCLFEKGVELIPIEIKSGKTVTEDAFKGVDHWQKLAQLEEKEAYIIYGGESPQKRHDIQVLSWKEAGSIF